jgi:hypothetical protein
LILSLLMSFATSSGLLVIYSITDLSITCWNSSSFFRSVLLRCTCLSDGWLLNILSWCANCSGHAALNRTW